MIKEQSKTNLTGIAVLIAAVVALVGGLLYIVYTDFQEVRAQRVQGRLQAIPIGGSFVTETDVRLNDGNTKHVKVTIEYTIHPYDLEITQRLYKKKDDFEKYAVGQAVRNTLYFKFAELSTDQIKKVDLKKLITADMNERVNGAARAFLTVRNIEVTQ